MYSLAYKLTTILIFAIIIIVLFYLFPQYLSHYQPNFLIIYKLVPHTFIVCAIFIIGAPMIIGYSGHWIGLAISVLVVLLLSIATRNPVYNIQSVVLVAVAVITHIFYKKRSGAFEIDKEKLERLSESENIVADDVKKLKAYNQELSERLKRYQNLRDIGESFSAKLSLDEICRLAVETAYKIVPESDAALLFLVNEHKQKLELAMCKTNGELPRIKSKTGDIFDHWVFKERQPLNVTDIKEDFRFDYAHPQGERPFTSLISVPLISQFRIIGVLRLNSKDKQAYTFDDLRLLDFISDLVSSAINNARLYKATEELSIRDSLTGLYVHRYLTQRLEEETKRAVITSSPLSAIMIDIDHFKDYNDRYGHSAGDKVLHGISHIIKSYTKEGAIAARYGGEEFVIALPNTTKAEAIKLAEGIRKAIASHIFMLRRKETRVTISAGVAEYIPKQEDIDQQRLIKKADFMLYSAKKKGRNQVCSSKEQD